MKLLGKTAVVTGGGRGIGRAIALQFAREGANLVLAARTEPELRETLCGVEALGRRGVAIRADVSNWEDAREIARQAVHVFGGIDILVNNAGIQGDIGPVAEADVEYWIRTVTVNLIGPFLCCRAVLPSMIARRKGKVINLSGGGALGPRARFSAYSAAKAGVVRFTECLAQEVKDFNIQVNAIAPGAVRTHLWEDIEAAGEKAGPNSLDEAKRFQASGFTPPERAAELALFLASPESDGLTGRIISAVYDDWEHFPARIDEIMASEVYTMRRINPPK